MTAYTDYAFYTGTFKGSAIASADFDKLALRATAIIDMITFGRAEPIVTAGADLTTIEKIEFATCEVAEQIQKIEVTQDGNAGIASESLGSHSVSYAQTAETKMSAMAKYEKAAKIYLVSTGLLYRGFTEDE